MDAYGFGYGMQSLGLLFSLTSLKQKNTENISLPVNIN